MPVKRFFFLDRHKAEALLSNFLFIFMIMQKGDRDRKGIKRGIGIERDRDGKGVRNGIKRGMGAR